MKRLIATLLIATFTLFSGCAHVTPLQSSEITVLHDSEVAQEAWRTALRMAKVTEPWTMPSNIVVFHFSNPELWGQTFFYTQISPDGRPLARETILVYCPDRNSSNLFRNILIHEFLHCIHARLKIIDPKFRGIEDEAFVCGLGACPSDPRLVRVQGKE